MADGTRKAIEDLNVGDKVASRNVTTGKDETHTVTRTFVHHDMALYEVKVGGGKVTTTADHPFYVHGKGWTAVKDLRPGEQLDQPDGTTVAVQVAIATGRTATVYNFEVESAHDYYVQACAHWVLVHNTCEIDADGIVHATDRHTWGGAELDAYASVFDNGVDLAALAKGSSGQIGRVGKYGNIEYTVKVRGAIGVTSRSTTNSGGISTNVYTIVRNPYDGSLITMFPRTP
jgi:hypothetical protein